MSPLLSVDDLRVVLGDVAILDGVSLSLGRGELVLLLGRSGTGKSVFIKSMLGFIPVERGTVHLDGRACQPARDAEYLRAHITLVHQDPALLDDETVLDNVALPLRWRFRMRGHQARARAMAQLERVGMKEVANSSALSLSAGERKLIALARALAMEPKALLLDEPTTGLDVGSAARVGRVCAEIVSTGTAMLVVTHDVTPFAPAAHRVALLHQGRLLLEEEAGPAFAAPPETLRQFLEARAHGPLTQESEP